MARVNVEMISSEEEVGDSENLCFQCKDGGVLLVCDYKGCLKAYHPLCVGETGKLFKSVDPWICRRHKCLVCRKEDPAYSCYCCDRAVCSHCIGHISFVVTKSNYGFCDDCLKIAVLVEKDLNVDSNGKSVDLKDLETSEGRFREYYEIIKEKVGLDKNCILAAKARMDEGSAPIISSGSDDIPFEEKDGESALDDGEALKQGPKKKRRGQQKEKMIQRRVNTKKKEYVGWGSKALIDFLQFIGQDTREKLSLREVTSKVINYIKEHNLTHPVKKKRVICDAQLQAVFMKEEVYRHRIYGLLEKHFAENEEQLEGHNHDDDPESPASKRVKKSEPNRISSFSYPAAAKSEFAAVIFQNINLVYLKKSLLLEIMKQPQSVENKLIGSFVRVKLNPQDTKRNSPHQLAQIEGVKLGSSDQDDSEISLQVSDMPGDVCLSSLSDADFSQEECEGLREKVKAGLLKQLTVVELEQKVKLLREDIVKHCQRIAKEVHTLQIRIDLSNEKGWRTQMYEHLDRKQLIQKPEYLDFELANIPLVIADEIEPEPVSKDE